MINKIKDIIEEWEDFKNKKKLDLEEAKTENDFVDCLKYEIQIYIIELILESFSEIYK